MKDDERKKIAIGSLIRPSSIALVGASERTRTLEWLLSQKYPGKIFPVNPKYRELRGLRCYPSLRNIPEPIDTVLIMVSREHVMSILEQAVEKGAKSATIYSAGFADIGAEGKALQQRITDFAKENGIGIVGPNALGVLNIKDRISSGISSILVEKSCALFPGNVSIVAQSGGLGDSLLAQVQARGVGVNYHFQTGNEADLEASDFMRFLIEDSDTRIIMAYIEGFKDGDSFIRVAEEALQKKKPIILYKVGLSQLGQRAAQTHTGSMTGSDLVHDMLFRQKGVIRVREISDLIETVYLFSRYVDNLPNGNRIGIVSASGGVTALLADKAGEIRLNLPDLSKNTETLIKDILRFATVSNPMDLTGEVLANSELLYRFLKILMRDENIDMMVYGFGLATGRDLPAKTSSALIEGFNEVKKPVVALMVGASAAKSGYETLEENGIPLFREDVEKCLKAVRALANYSLFLRRLEDKPSAPFILPKMPRKELEPLLSEYSTLGEKNLTEHMSKILLAQFGIPTTKEKIATSLAEAEEAAGSIGYPLVVKVNSPTITHKTEAKAVVVGVNNRDELFCAYREVLENARKYNPKAQINGVLIQEMVKGGTEVIMGITYDAQFGPTIVFGLGGIYTEVFKDISCRVAPITPMDAEEMIHEIKAFPLLNGFRGRRKADIQALVDILLKLSRLAVELKDRIQEVDINPVIVFDEGNGAKAVDALIVLRQN